MERVRFRGQHFGIFEKSLRSEDSAKNPATEQRTPHIDETGDLEEHLGKKTQQHDSTNKVEGRRRQSVFYAHEIKKIMDEILEEKLSTQSYDANICRVLCVSLSEDIKSRVKNLGMERFRLICSVSIGSNCGQGILMASRFLWNDCRDNFSTSSFQNASLFAVAIVFGVLKE
ncbi:tctex1 domain-containing protein 1-like [Stylophora pistillata]|uniref:tctex1 domain-containing protein 1-like n=1 Tax=Stylophora pistillata TaxID=50429 RepID=UPI000C04BEB1|nr:tctex1 domain-containing protein 1-like [Stylophora pistillata]